MKVLTRPLIVLTSLTFFSACGVLPIKHTVKADNFRFENVQSSAADEYYERIYLMCHNKHPEEWRQARQYKAGLHNLWIKALIREQDRPINLRRGYANFQMELDPGISYMPNKKVEGNVIHLWIQEVESGKRVSNIVTTDLELTHLSRAVQ